MDALVDALCEGWKRAAEAEREQAPELSHAQPLEMPAPRPPPEPQAEIAPEADALIEDWSLQAEAEAEPELEIG
jgi:hypothetical protein